MKTKNVQKFNSWILLAYRLQHIQKNLCSSSGLCFLFMGWWAPINWIGGGMGPHQVGAHVAQVGSASCSWVMGLHQLVGAWAPTKWWGPMQLKWALLPVHGWWAPTNWWGPLILPVVLLEQQHDPNFNPLYHKLVFVLRKCSKTLLSNAEFKQFSGGNTPDPRFGGREGRRAGSLFLFSENLLELSYNNAEYKIFSGDYTTRPLF